MKRLSKTFSFKQIIYRHKGEASDFDTPVAPKYQDEINLSVFRRTHFDLESDTECEDPNRLQATLIGSKRSLRELGKYLINLSNIETTESGYHTHLEFPFEEGAKGLELIVRVPSDTKTIILSGPGPGA